MKRKYIIGISVIVILLLLVSSYYWIYKPYMQRVYVQGVNDGGVEVVSVIINQIQNAGEVKISFENGQQLILIPKPK